MRCALTDLLKLLVFVQGGDLKQALRGPLSATLSWYNKGAQIALDVIKGVHFLHCHGVSFCSSCYGAHAIVCTRLLLLLHVLLQLLQTVQGHCY